MKRNVYFVAVVMIAMLSAFFWAGGTKPVLAETVNLTDVAGISAYAKLTSINLEAVKSAFLSIEYQALDGTFLIGKVDAGAYADVYDPYVLVTSDGWIVAYYPNTDVAGKMIDVMSRQLIDKTLLQKAVEAVGGTGITVSYYDFAYSDATNMLLVGEYQADGDAFTLSMPSANTYYEKSYGFYRTYEPSFTLDNDQMEQVNFVLDNADYFNPAVYGTIYGHFGDFLGDVNPIDFNADTDYTFTVWNRDFYAFGALAILYSGVDPIDPIVVGDADYVREIALVVPAGLPTITFDFTPKTFTKNEAYSLVDMPLDWTLSWNPSTAPNYEYCIDTTNDTICDTGWVNVGDDLSVILSNLFYDTTYYWQVRAINSTATVEADGGVWGSFTTDIRVDPEAFAKVSGGLDDPVGGPISLDMAWDSSYGAYYYEYCVDTTADCIAPELWHNVGLDTTATVSDLLLNTTYHWQVRAANYDADGIYYTYANTGETPEWWSVTTRTFGKISPLDASADDVTKPLIWESTPGANRYEYCLATTLVIDSSTCTSTKGWISTKLDTMVSFKKLTPAVYYWQVRAVTDDGYEYADDGAWWSFEILAKSSRITLFKVSPVNGAIEQPISLTLSWKATKVGATYEFCYFPVDDTDTTPISADDTCSYSNEFWFENPTTLVDISGLAYTTTYYWQVRGWTGEYDADGDKIYIYADHGDLWSFTTGPEPVP